MRLRWRWKLHYPVCQMLQIRWQSVDTTANSQPDHPFTRRRRSMSLPAFEADIFGQSIGDSSCVIQDALHAIRTHLDMEVAYLSEFVDGRSVFRRVDAPGLEHLIQPGDSMSLDDVYCNHILEGRLPELIPDTATLPFAMSIPITRSLPIGSHASIPIRLADGTPYGMFCCLSPRANPSLNGRDLDMMRVFAGIAAKQVNSDLQHTLTSREARTSVERIIADRAFSIAYQPIFDLASGDLVSFEALCRFNALPYQTPDKWFLAAERVGLGVELELAAISMAVEAFESLPSHLSLSVNASPEAAASPALIGALQECNLNRTVLEITEHARVKDYVVLHSALAPLKSAGLKVAIDDAGAGYSGLQHIVQLAPEIIKLDMSLTQRIDSDPARRALASAMTFFARDTNAVVVAEGIETVSEMQVLRQLGVDRGQGYLLGKPMPLEKAHALSVC